MTVTFVLPTADDDNWVRTGRGFRALQAYKDRKKGIAKMVAITYRNAKTDEEIRDFLTKLITRPNHPKVEEIMTMTHAQFLLSRYEGDTAEKFKKLRTIFHEEEKDLDRHMLSDWLKKAEESGIYPLSVSTDETDEAAIATANQGPADAQEADGDMEMDA